MTRPSIFPVLPVLAVLVPQAAAQLPAVSPASRAALEGDSSTSYPLGRARCRLQQLIADLPAGAIALRGHAYRRDAIATRGLVDAYRCQMSVTLSLSPRTPAQASRTFADNHGSAPQRTLDRQWISFPATDRPAADPAPTFALRVPWTTPFAWPGSGVVCLETQVHGNDVGGQANRNFTSYQDAHDAGVGGSRQPGFRFGAGCPADGASAAAYASFELAVGAGGTMLEVAARNGAPTDGAGPGHTTLLVGLQPASWSWPSRPECTLLLTPLWAATLPGANDASGHWDGGVAVGPARAGQVLLAQCLSLQPATGRGALADASRLTIPMPPPTAVDHARIAAASDDLASTGTVALSVPVTELF